MELQAAARRMRRHEDGSVTEVSGAGTGLGRALDGARAEDLLGLVGSADRVELEDDEVHLVLVREAGGVRVSTRWSTGEEAEQLVAGGGEVPVADLVAALHTPGRVVSARGGRWFEGAVAGADLVVPAVRAEQLGSAAFRASHGLRYAYLAGAMAGGIASAEVVEAMGKAGYMGFFGAGGLDLEAVRRGVARIRAALPTEPAGFNLLHNPAEPAMEEHTVDVFLEHGVRTIDASAFLELTPALVRFRLAGITEVDGRIHTPNRVLAKVSRPELTEPFLRPAPARVVEELVARGVLSARQAELARHVPVATDITPEADSGGHTDRRPLSVLIPLFRRLRDRVCAEQGYAELPRIGAAGGIADPWSLAAALQLGADYVMTGSINQATLEAGTSDVVKEMLVQAGFADVMMGPAPDMFEIGAQVQVLSRGSMYAQRAAKLYELYRAYGSIDDIPQAERQKIEKQIFQRPLAEVWTETEAYWRARDPREVERAANDPHHQMALVFRWYLGLTSRWARMGEGTRKRDFQVWCGPAMGLFNDWVRGSWLEPLSARSVTVLADTLMRGACVATRVQMVRSAGLPLPEAAMAVGPVPA